MKQYAIIGIILTLCFQAFTSNNNLLIPEEAIRLRVLANSNSSEDQKLKMKVSETVQKNLYQLLKDTKGIESDRNKINENLPSLKQQISNTLKLENSSIPFQLDYGIHYFPQKVYKGVTYEEGEYESLLVTLGKGEGDNWWCVLFPPLCIMEAEETEVKEETEYKFFIQELIEKYL